MHNRHNIAIRTLTDITTAIIEYDLHLDQNRLVNFIDLYRVYLQTLSNIGLDSTKVPVTFLQFIFDQALLDSSAFELAIESREPVNAPAALPDS